jgi:cell division protein FtsW (lipid II flippase)
MSDTLPSATPAKSFAPNHPWDRNFFLVMVALAWLGILRGFGADVVDHVTKHKPAFALIVHFHAVVFVAWLALFTVQISLVRLKKLSVHKRLGLALVWLAALMMILGPATALTVQHRAMGDPKADPAF